MRSLPLNAANNKPTYTDIAGYITEQYIDMCCLTETWMTENDLVTVNYTFLTMIWSLSHVRTAAAVV